MELELSSFQKEITKLVLDTSSPGKHAARSAIFHIQKAWQIKDIDPEMAVFRAITGEEESATAIFHSLRKHDYAGAKNLNPKKHFHKAAVVPFFQAVARDLNHFCKQADFDPKIEIRKEKSKTVVKVRVTVTVGTEKKYAYPEPPLNWKFELNDKLHEFKGQIQQIASEKNMKDIIKYINLLANKRNMILYASSQGVPRIQGSIDNYLKTKRNAIFHNLTVYLMIDPYKEKQLFVEQALNVFLKTLNLIPENLTTHFT